MDIIIAAYLSFTSIGALVCWSFDIAFGRRFGWRLLFASLPKDFRSGLYYVLSHPLNLPLLGLMRLVDPDNYRRLVVESTLAGMEEVAARGELEVPMQEIVAWLKETLGAPHVEVVEE